MPNWCDCELRVSGTPKDVRALEEAVRSEDSILDANKIIPYPDEYRELDEEAEKYDLGDKDRPKDGFNQGGYEWCISNWGTKWGFCHVSATPEEEWGGLLTIGYDFDTAWSPPLPLIKKLGEMFPTVDLVLTYFEGGCGFNGRYEVESGEVTMDATGAYFGSRGG